MSLPTSTNDVTARKLSAVIDGLWAKIKSTFAKPGDITTAIQALDVSSVGGDGKYISAISETNGKISATSTTMDTTPTASSTKAVTSGGIKTALDGKSPTSHTHSVKINGSTKTIAASGGTAVDLGTFKNFKYAKVYVDTAYNASSARYFLLAERETTYTRFWQDTSEFKLTAYSGPVPRYMVFRLSFAGSKTTCETPKVCELYSGNLTSDERKVIEVRYTTSVVASTSITVHTYIYIDRNYLQSQWTSFQLEPLSIGIGDRSNNIDNGLTCWSYKTAETYVTSLTGTTVAHSSESILVNISGNASTATKATQDSDGNAINATYFKSSGNVTLVSGTATKIGTQDGSDVKLTLPTIPAAANNGALKIGLNGGTATSKFTANQSGDSTLTFATGSSNGTISVDGTDVAVKGLGGAAYLNTGTASGTVATGNHTHTTSIASDSSSGTVVTLAHNTQYKLTAGGTSVLFKTPADNNTDTKVTQTADNSSTGTGFELLFSATADNTTRTEASRKSSKLTFQPSTGTLTATKFSGPLTGNVTGNCSGSSGSCTGNAATATTATNANITRTADTANGDKLQIGTGTAVNITNAKHAASADSAKSGSELETAINGKQPGRLVVTIDDNTAFSKISTAIAAGKDVWLNTNATDSGATYSHYVPLTEAVFRSGSYTAFIFARPRAYGDENGIVDKWTCESSSWTYDTEYVAYADTAGTAATAGTANSASNANLGKTSDATNGDLLYIGGGTQQRVTNAAHATSAKNYDQTGSIATALKSKQNLLYFTNTDGGTTSNPAADKKYVDSSIASWMLAVGTSYVKYRCNGEGIGSGNIGSIFWLSQIIYLAQDTVRIDIRGDFSSITKDNRFAIFPAYAYCGLNGSTEIRYKCKQYVRYIITLTNVGHSSATIWAISGGRATQSRAGYIRRGTLQIDGAIFETDTVSQPQNWDIGYFNFGAIGSIPAKSSRTWEMFWFGTEDTPGTAFSGCDYTYITTIK